MRLALALLLAALGCASTATETGGGTAVHPERSDDAEASARSRRASTPTATATPTPTEPAEPAPALQLPDDVRPLRYALDLRVVPTDPAGFRGTAEIAVELAAPRSVLWLHGRGLRVSRATVEPAGAAPLEATFAQVSEDGVAKLALPRPIGPGRATLRLAWEASWDPGLRGLYLAREGADVYAATQLQAIDARRVFPGFDEPRFKTPFDVTLTVPAAAVAISNAPASAEEPAGDGLRRVRFAATEPLPTYLVFLGVGPFEIVTPPPLPPNEVRARPLPVRFVVPRGHRDETRLAAEATAAFVPWFERYFAIPYPNAKLDQIALPEFAAGAMENAGAIAYRNAALLVSPATSADDRLGIASIIAHEIAHEWFGNLVTLPWWTDTWLNEGFATWIGGHAADAWQPGWGEAARRLRQADDVMQADTVASARPVRLPLRATSEIPGQFDGMSYEKGAAVLRAFERFAGPERFRDGVRAYLAARRHGTGSGDALFAELSRAAGAPLGPALAGFTERPGVPAVAARVACEGGRARLLLAQSRFVPRGSAAAPGERWSVPVCARWETAGARREGCVMLDGAEGALDLGAGCPAWVMPHAGAASYHRWTLAPEDLARLRRAGTRRLATVEKVSLARNLRAAQQSGAQPWGEAMAALAALAADPDPDAALEPIAVLELARDRLVPPEARPAVAAFARRLYAPVLARVGWEPRRGEPLAAGRLRRAAVELLALSAGDPAVRREAARRGRALLASMGGPSPAPAAGDPGLAQATLAAAIAEGGAPVFEEALAKLARLEDATLRAKLVAALGRQEDPALSARASPRWRGPEVRRHEVRYLFGGLAGRAAGREALLGIWERDVEALAARLSRGALTFYTGTLAEGCDPGFAERVRAAVGPHVERYPELGRRLAQALERIAVCSAEREASGAEAAAFFAGRAARPRREPARRGRAAGSHPGRAAAAALSAD